MLVNRIPLHCLRFFGDKRKSNQGIIYSIVYNKLIDLRDIGIHN